MQTGLFSNKSAGDKGAITSPLKNSQSPRQNSPGKPGGGSTSVRSKGDVLGDKPAYDSMQQNKHSGGSANVAMQNQVMAGSSGTQSSSMQMQSTTNTIKNV